MEYYAKQTSSGLYGLGALNFYDFPKYISDVDMPIPRMRITVVDKNDKQKYKGHIVNNGTGFVSKSPYLAHTKWYSTMTMNSNLYDNCIFVKDLSLKKGDKIIITFSKFVCEPHFGSGFGIIANLNQ